MEVDGRVAGVMLRLADLFVAAAHRTGIRDPSRVSFWRFSAGLALVVETVEVGEGVLAAGAMVSAERLRPKFRAAASSMPNPLRQV